MPHAAAHDCRMSALKPEPQCFRHTQATVVWRITNVCEAARMSAETMRRDGGDISDASQSDVNKLRK